MQVFSHHVYEFRKGLRNLVLHTTRAEHRDRIEDRLTNGGIDYVIHPVGSDRINVFFGADECVEVIRRIDKASLCDYTDEEDFMLGVMLGYDRLAQCRRYLRRCEDAAIEDARETSESDPRGSAKYAAKRAC